MRRLLVLGAALTVVAALGLQTTTSAAPAAEPATFPYGVGAKIGRASCRERV